MTDEAFKRRFYEDRAELAALGIEIAAEPRPGDRRRALQPAGQRLLPAADRAGPRRAHGPGRLPRRARGPLRLLAAAAPGPAQPGAGPPRAAGRGRDAGARRPPRGGRGRGARGPAQAAGGHRRPQDRQVRVLRDQPRRGDGAHRRPLRPAARRRRVVPHRLVPPAPGHAHLPALAHPLARDARHARPARLRGAGRLRHRRLSRPPALAARRRPRHRPHPRRRRDGLVGRGALRALRHDRARRTAAPSSSRPPLRRAPGRCSPGCSVWRRRREVLEPQALRDERRAAPAPARRPAGRRRRRRRRPPRRRRRTPPARRAARPAADWHVDVDRFTRLTALTTYLLRSCGERRSGGARASPTSAPPSTSSREELRADVRLLNLVNFGADGALLYAEYKGRDRLEVYCDLAGPAFARPARLSPLQADTLLLAVELVGGQLPTDFRARRWRARRTSCAPRAHGGAPDDRHGRPAAAGRRRSSTPSTRPSRQRRLLAIEYWRRARDARRRAHRRALPAACAAAASGTTSAGAARPEAGASSAWRPPRRRGCSTRSSSRARTWSSTCTGARASPRRRATRRAPPRCGTALWCGAGSRSASRCSRCRTAPAWRAQPYVDASWLTHYLLRFAGQARPLAPPDAVDDVRHDGRAPARAPSRLTGPSMVAALSLIAARILIAGLHLPAPALVVLRPRSAARRLPGTRLPDGETTAAATGCTGSPPAFLAALVPIAGVFVMLWFWWRSPKAPPHTKESATGGSPT